MSATEWFGDLVGQLVHLRGSVSQAEPYRTRREVASAMGVSERTVARWAKAGCPSVVWGDRSRRYLLSEVARWARKDVAV